MIYSNLPNDYWYDEPTRIMEIIYEDPELYKRWKWFDNRVKERLKKGKQEIKIYALHPYEDISSYEFIKYPTYESINKINWGNQINDGY